MKKRSWHKGLYLLLIVAQQVWGQIPQAVSFQGVLKDNSGNILSDGPYSLTYSLYSNLTGGSALWSATQVDTVKSGVLSAVIGRSSPISLAFDGQYYLGIAIGAASELTPRIQLTSSAYSLNARSVRGGTNVFPADGNVGIGTTSPSRKLHIAGGASDWPLYVTGTSNLFLADGGGGALLTAKLVQISNGAGTEVVVLGNGNVGIGVTNPGSALQIAQGRGSAIADNWQTYSSRRWKTNIKSLENAMDTVKRLRGVSYDWKKTGRHDIGLIAEEVGEVVPEVVSYEDEGKDARGVDYARLVAILIEATKEQQTQIAQQQGAIDELNRRLVTLEKAMESYSAEMPKAENLIAKGE